MIFWEDLVKAEATARKELIDIEQALRQKQLEVEASVPASELTGTPEQNATRIMRTVLADSALQDLLVQHHEAQHRAIDAKAELSIAVHRTEERLVEAHEANMKFAEQIHKQSAA